MGCRYDGLYEITRESVEMNENGGAYVRFRLERCAGQPEIDVARTTKGEKKDAERGEVWVLG